MHLREPNLLQFLEGYAKTVDLVRLPWIANQGNRTKVIYGGLPRNNIQIWRSRKSNTSIFGARRIKKANIWR